MNQEGSITSRGFNSSVNNTNPREIPTSSTSAALRISFNASNKTVYSYFDADGAAGGYSWTYLTSYGIDGSGGSTANGDWAMTADDAFEISLYGFSKATAVPAGQLYFDDFRLAPLPINLTEWKEQYFGNAAAPEAGDAMDVDQDGIPNIMEFALGLRPTLSDVAVITPGLGTSGLPFAKPQGRGHRFDPEHGIYPPESLWEPGVAYEPQISSNLATWQSASGSETVTSVNSEWERVVVTAPAPTGQAARFGRLKVEASPTGN